MDAQAADARYLFRADARTSRAFDPRVTAATAYIYDFVSVHCIDRIVDSRYSNHGWLVGKCANTMTLFWKLEPDAKAENGEEGVRRQPQVCQSGTTILCCKLIAHNKYNHSISRIKPQRKYCVLK